MADVFARGVRFHVQRIGAGPQRVVFLHGLVMDNLSSWYFSLATAVARNAEVLLYDLRGHGKSERTADGYGLASMVDDLEALLTELNVRDPVYLVGNSFGGLLALAFAVKHARRVAGLVIVDGHLAGDRWGAEMAQTLSLQGQQRDRMIAQSFSSWLGRHSERKSTRLARKAGELVYETSLVQDLRATPPLTDAALRAIDCPVLAIYGERSDILDHGRRLARLVPSTTMHVVAGCTHSVLWEQTDALRERVCEWLGRRAGLSARTGS